MLNKNLSNVIKTLRTSLKFLSIFMVLSTYLFILVALFPFYYVSPKAHFVIMSFFRHLFSRFCAFVVRLKVKVFGTLPPSPFFLVSNHVSYLDIILISSVLKCTYIAKQEVSQWPFFGILSRMSGTISLDRRQKRSLLEASDAVGYRMSLKDNFVVFPEGTTTKGDTVLPFKSSVFQYALDYEIPVYTGTLFYQVPKGELDVAYSVCWWGDMTLVSSLWTLCSLSSVYATLTFSEAPLMFSDRKTMANRAHADIMSRFVPFSRSES